eukprot:IDg19743t1
MATKRLPHNSYKIMEIHAILRELICRAQLHGVVTSSLSSFRSRWDTPPKPLSKPLETASLPASPNRRFQEPFVVAHAALLSWAMATTRPTA